MGTVANPAIKSDMFPAAGETTFTPTSPSTVVLIPGTYEGAAGSYRCTTDCTAQAAAGGIELSTNWEFIHVEGATVEVSVADADYLYFGWWLQKDDDDLPTLAGAFTGVQGTAIVSLLTNPNVAGGTATYTGHAAGKFAVSDPLGADNAGHFTADATLTAVFAMDAVGGGLSGTLDNFMANDDEAMPWSVTLLRRGWVGDHQRFGKRAVRR